MHKVTLGLLLALNLLNLTSITVLAQDAPKSSGSEPKLAPEATPKTSLADLRTKFGLYRAEEPVKSTCIVGAVSGTGTSLLTYSAIRLSKTKPKGLAGLATTAGLCVGTLAAIKFSGDNLTHLRSLQIAELQRIKSQAHTVSTSLSDLITEHGLVRSVIDKVHSLTGKNQQLVQTELQKSKELADLITKTSRSVDQLGTDVTKQTLELENILGRHLDASHKTQLARTTRELALAQAQKSPMEHPADKR